MKKNTLLFSLWSLLFTLHAQDSSIILQGIIDFSVPSGGNDGKAIHLVATSDIADISIYGIGVANNGGGTDGQEETFPVMSVSAGDDILLARTPSAMESYFGACYASFEHVLTSSSAISQNGDDAIELFQDSLVIETFGDIDTDGTGESWEYLDSWAYKVDGGWTYGAVNCTDGTTTTLSSSCIYPLCDTGEEITGCTDSLAFNYNPNAVSDDGSCIAVSEGCMIMSAANYDETVNTPCEDCCEFSGCTDSLALNFDESFTLDDGSCIYNTTELSNALSLQGIMDFTVPSGGSDGKAIHLVALSDIADISIFGIGVANNGGGTDGLEETLPIISVSAGDDILLARTPSVMEAYFADCYTEFEHVLLAGSDISQNGDDAIELYESGVVIETFGDIDTDGTGEVWEYLDSWAYKVGEEWTYGGVDCSDGSETTQASTCPYPMCEATTPCSVPADWQVTVTSSNHTIMIPSETIFTDEIGNELSNVFVGVFFQNSNGEMQCAGYTEWNGNITQIAAMGDDSTTDEIDGMTEGQNFVWMVLDCSDNEIYPASVTWLQDSPSYTSSGINFIESISIGIPGPSEQILSIGEGWSMISTYMIPNNTALDDILSPIVGQVIIAKDYLGAAYLPEYNFNGVGDITVGQGYQIKLVGSAELIILGDYVLPEENPIDLVGGWNTIGYLRLNPASADQVLSDLVLNNNLVIAKDYLGAAYLPEFNFNGIGDLAPGLGYQIKTENSGVLQYLSNDDSYRISSISYSNNNTLHFSPLLPTDNNMTIVIPSSSWDIFPKVGAEISIFSPNGKIVGVGLYNEPTTVISVWGDDVTTDSKDGLLIGENIRMELWNNNETKSLTVSNWIDGTGQYTINDIQVVGNLVSNVIHSREISLFNASPNPSSDHTELSFEILESSDVSLILTNVLGEQVKLVLNNQFLPQGIHRINVNTSALNSGTYFYTLLNGTESMTKYLNIYR